MGLGKWFKRRTSNDDDETGLGEHSSGTKYKVTLSLPDGTTEEVDELFDSWEEADAGAAQWSSDYFVGNEIMHMSNPGDYPLAENTMLDWDIEEVDD